MTRTFPVPPKPPTQLIQSVGQSEPISGSEFGTEWKSIDFSVLNPKHLIRNLIAWFQTFMPIYVIKFTLRGKEHTLKQSFKSLRDAKMYLRDLTREDICSLGEDTKIVRIR